MCLFDCEMYSSCQSPQINLAHHRISSRAVDRSLEVVHSDAIWHSHFFRSFIWVIKIVFFIVNVHLVSSKMGDFLNLTLQRQQIFIQSFI